MVRPLDIGKAEVRFEHSVPFSEAHGDIYYSRNDGLAESRYVFLGGNDLPARWSSANRFTIGETGFGTGLNFLATWQAWRQSAPAHACLDYVSAERYPLDREGLATALGAFPELEDLTRHLITQYPPRLPGFHRLTFDQGRVRLTLLFGDAAAAFARLEGRVDAWYLDGFAPARNQSMWTPTLFDQLARCSRPGATLATFTSAGDVRRGLQSAGFLVTKTPGFAGKRERITARIETSAPTDSETPWFAPPEPLAPPHSAVIVGGGIAGCAMTEALTRRGIHCTLIERDAEIAAAASGNPAGLLMPKLTADQSLSSRYYTEAYRYTLNLIQNLGASGHEPTWAPCGVLQLGYHEKVRASHARVSQRELPPDFARVVDAAEAGRLAGAPMPLGGLWFSGGGWIDPRSFCQALLDSAQGAHLRVVRATEAVALERVDNAWSVRARGGKEIAHGQHVIVCTGADTQDLLADIGQALTTIRGQITRVPVTAETRPVRSVVCYKGYLTPAVNGEHITGATYDRDELSGTLRVADHRDNLQKLHRVLPEWFHEIRPEDLDGRVAFRSTTPDRLPLIGNVPDTQRYRDVYGDLWKGRKPARYPTAPGLAGVWVSAGHSSRGLIGAPLAAEVIASEIAGEPLPLERELLDAVHPGRFMIRDLKRRRQAGP